MRLSGSTFKSFWREASPQYFTEQANGTIKANSSIFRRGKHAGLSFRFYDESIQKLYNSVKCSEHRYLGYVFSMLRYVNIKYNILCYNPTETEVDKVEPMTFGEFAEQIGYDAKSLCKLYDIYACLRFDVGNNQSERFCNVTDRAKLPLGKRLMYINPRLLYSGGEADRVGVLKFMFNDN